MMDDRALSTPSPTPLPLRPLGANMNGVPGDQIPYLSLYLGFDHVIGSVAVDGSGLNNDARLTSGKTSTVLLNFAISLRRHIYPGVTCLTVNLLA